MAVVQATIKAQLLTLYNEMRAGSLTTEVDFADRMATIIKDAILSAVVNTNVTVTPGTAVQVSTGSGTGATIAPGIGTGVGTLS